MSEKEWDTIRPILPIENTGPGRPIEIDMREAVNGMLYVAKTA
jgi:transposase